MNTTCRRFCERTSYYPASEMSDNIPTHKYPGEQVPSSSSSPSAVSSLSSLMSSPIAARLSTFLPFSWATNQTTAAASRLIPSSNVFDDQVAPQESCNRTPRERRYVSRDLQLDKLRTRLHATTTMTARGGGSGSGDCAASDICCTCRGDLVTM
jgi:hypothetical protein